MIQISKRGPPPHPNAKKPQKRTSSELWLGEILLISENMTKLINWLLANVI